MVKILVVRNSGSRGSGGYILKVELMKDLLIYLL